MILPMNLRFLMRLRFFLPLPLFFLAAAIPAPANAQSDCTGVSPTTIGGVTWTPVFCDEFNGMAGSAPNAMIWTYDTGNSGFGNNEIETYCAPGSNTAPCSSASPNIALDGSGHLLIQAILSGGQWTSGRMKTQGLKDFQYGWIEARIQLPDTTNQGLWPAFWSLGSNIATTPWPACGEADILEVWSPSKFNGPGPGGNRSTIHTAMTGGNGLQPNGQYTFPTGQANNTALHAYGVIWSANMMQYYVDNPTTPFYVTTASDLSASDTWPFNAKIFLIMNVAVGGTLGGIPSSSTPNPGIMTVDYVRQYQPSAIPAPVLPSPPSITVKAGATTGNSSTFTPGLTPPGYVYFTCSTTAPKASCSIATNDPLNTHVVNSSAAAETVTVSVTTTANAILPPFDFRHDWRFWLPIATLAVLLMAFAAFALRRGRTTLRPAYVLTALLLVVALVAGCGGGSSGPPPPPPPSGGTAPGTYAITVNAFTESNTSGTADATAQITLNVN